MRKLQSAAIFLLIIFVFANLSAQTAKKPSAITVAGRLERVAGIGGETTGWAIELDTEMEIRGERVQSIEVTGKTGEFAKFENKHIQAVGTLAVRHGVTRGDWTVLDVKSLRESR